MLFHYSIRGAGALVGAVFSVARQSYPTARHRRTSAWRQIMCGIAMGALPFAADAQTYRTAYDDDGVVTVNGTRTFILGTYHYTTRGQALDPDGAMKELSGAGFNLVNVRLRDTVAARAAASTGLMVWAKVGALVGERDGEALRFRVRFACALPGLAFLETVDEPAWTWKKAKPRVPADALIRAYPIIKEEAPNHLLYTNHAPTNLVSTLQRYNAGTDIVAVDIYPVNPGYAEPMFAQFEDGLHGDLNNTYLSQSGEYVRKMRRVAGPGRPVFAVEQAFAWEMLRDKGEQNAGKVLYPTYRELRFMAHQAIIEGANGIIYWGNRYTPKPSQGWDDVKRVVSELAALNEPLAARTVDLAPKIEYHELGHSVDDGVAVRIKDVGDTRYAFTCNADRYPCRATLSGFGEWQRATLVDEAGEIEFEDGTITDDWEAFGVHVYRLER